MLFLRRRRVTGKATARVTPKPRRTSVTGRAEIGLLRAHGAGKTGLRDHNGLAEGLCVKLSIEPT